MAQASTRGLQHRPRKNGGMDTCFRANFNLYRALARECASGGDVERACLAYRNCLQTLRRANLLTHGRWREEEAEVRQELSDFLLGCAPDGAGAGDDHRIPLEC